jgi:hypothetical protein
MIKYFILIGVLGSCLACKKSYTCECVFKIDKTDQILANQTKKQATKACSDINKTWQDSDGGCSLTK